MIKLLFILLLPFCISAQETIEVSEDYSTILIFPSEIEGSPILGNEQEYIIKQTSNSSNISKRIIRLGYIKVDEVEKNTNLIVFTKDGNNYSFLLKYAKVPVKLDPYYVKLKKATTSPLTTEKATVNSSKNLKIKEKESYYTLGVETKEVKEEVYIEKKSNTSYHSNKEDYIISNCKIVNNNSKQIFRIYDKSSNIKLSLKEVSYDKDEIYFHLLLENKGGQSFDVDFINTRLARGYKGVSTDQSISLTPLLIYNKPSRVRGKNKVNFIMVFKKFSINDKKELQIDLAEKEGERDLLLRINNKLINNPVKLNR